MSIDLLDKTRCIHRLLNEQEFEKIDFMVFCQELSGMLEANVMLVSRKGKVLGLKERKDIAVIPQIEQIRYGDYIEKVLQERFMNILSTKENVNLMTLGFFFEESKEYDTMISPICMAGRRLGTLFVYRYQLPFSIDDIILTEYGTTVIGLAMQRAESEEISVEQHKEQDVTDALKTLSKLEGRAVYAVLSELNGQREGILVTSRIADKAGITRSVIVNALKKCESAGIIRTKSSGMKGTKVQIINDLFSCELVSRNMSLDKERKISP